MDLRAGHARGVLLLHGFGDTPQTLSYMARYLHDRGYDVRVPLLPGHGRDIASFNATSHEAWFDAARSELFAMRARYDWSGLCGLSMGGALAVLLAAQLRDLPSLVLLAPYLGMPLHARAAAATHRLWSDRVGPFRARSSQSILDPEERAASLAYGVVTGRALQELRTVVAKARSALPQVNAPTLIIQSVTDNRIPPGVAKRSLAALGTASKRLVFTRGAGHILTVDYGRERVFAEVQSWLERGPGTATPASESGSVTT
ncbi:MAG: alpha/beta hydrolase [Gemmatimonadaceae bacterium]